jgi:hypothetical protein
MSVKGIAFLLPVLAAAIALADDTPVTLTPEEIRAQHAECAYFGADREKFVSMALKAAGAKTAQGYSLSHVTNDVRMAMGSAKPRANEAAAPAPDPTGLIDSLIWADFKAHNIKPADRTTDFEFIRRVTLDLTGRIPSADRVLAFVADTSTDKRNKLVDDLLARSEWLDKWTMFFGDLYKNTDNRPSSGIRRFPQGRNAFYTWIRDSLREGKPYNQMASELISSTGTNSYEDGTLNFLVGWVVSGGPQQDITDSWAASVADTFLGISHVNCILCHNGRGHLDQLSLWGKNTTRYQGWQLSSFLSHTQQARTPVDPANNNIYYWSLQDNTRNFTNDYTLNTTNGNRPARTSTQAGCRSGMPCYTVPPVYIFNGKSPKPGENYRVALAREVTGDFQFARATVNYMWDQFFGRGIVDPVNTFDPARLDPDNPPPDPWTLQPSNARLLNTLAQGLIDNKYNLKWLMREIATSQTYQLSSRYNGDWNIEWEPYFARKFVRRLWAEEIHDAIVDSTFTYPNYNVANFSALGFGNIKYAMQAPDVGGMPTGAVSGFLDSFLRGNRDDNERKGEGSVQQALNLMNDTFITSRLAVTGSAASQMLVTALAKPDEEMVKYLFLNILSRYPSDEEKGYSLAKLKSGNRTQQMQDLVWSLFNKVDFIFNY